MPTHMTAEQRTLIYSLNKSRTSTAVIAQDVGTSQRTIQLYSTLRTPALISFAH